MYLCFDMFWGAKVVFSFCVVFGPLVHEKGSWMFLGSKLTDDSYGWGSCPTPTYME
jgi:hypothetical protein